MSKSFNVECTLRHTYDHFLCDMIIWTLHASQWRVDRGRWCKSRA